jgi:hypothetical protein
MTIRNGLVLDHFYFCFDDKAFADLVDIFGSLPGSKHSKVKSGSDSWEGLYLRMRTGSYIELLKDRRMNGFGVAISAARLHLLNPTRLRDEFPNLNWENGQRVNADGNPWFDWLSLCKYTNHSEIYFNAWLMHYHSNHVTPVQKIDRSFFDSVLAVKIACNPSMPSLISEQGFWIPGNHDFSNAASGNLKVPDRDGSEVHFSWNSDQSTTGFKIKSMQLILSRGVEFSPVENETFSCSVANGILTIQFKN